MKALTVCEPWAWAIVDLSLLSPEWKRVENRHAEFPRYSGPLLIHSGQRPVYWKAAARQIRAGSGFTPPAWQEIAGRGLIGLAKVACTVDASWIRSPGPRPSRDIRLWAEEGLDYPRLQHWAEGPLCICFSRVYPFAAPIPWRGQQGLFEVPDDRVAAAIERAKECAAMRGSVQ